MYNFQTNMDIRHVQNIRSKLKHFVGQRNNHYALTVFYSNLSTSNM